MIEIEEAKKVYQHYAKGYDLTDGKIALKVAHMERVEKISKKLAEQLEIEEEQVKLAQLIGLLHDIGRFEQIKRYHTFNDQKSIRHADLGVSILFEEGWIRKFVKDDSYDDIIEKAIYYHGRDKIEEGLAPVTRLQCQIIRDADKLDIFHILLTDEPENIFDDAIEAMKGDISDEMMELFLKEHRVDYTKKKTEAESIVQWLAYVFDINFKSSMQRIKEHDYISRLVKRFSFSDLETKKKIQMLEKETNSYMEEILAKK